MGILIAVISIILLLIGSKSNDDDRALICSTTGSLGIVIALIIIMLTTCHVVSSRLIDDKVAMYQSENTKIENDISTIVENYKDYESGVFKDSKANPTIALSMYPKLKSNELVVKEIDVYVKNNNKIKSLKEDKINYNADKWWLYFGGMN